jgi:hypothetical protein
MVLSLNCCAPRNKGGIPDVDLAAEMLNPESGGDRRPYRDDA